MSQISFRFAAPFSPRLSGFVSRNNREEIITHVDERYRRCNRSVFLSGFVAV
jgi:hypothetical protein